MEDTRIIDLYWTRSEKAIAETSAKYGKYCYAIAYNILSNPHIIKTFDEEPELQVLNGRFGPYIAYKGSNYKLPKSVTPAELTIEECLEIVKKQGESGKSTAKKRYTRKK